MPSLSMTRAHVLREGTSCQRIPGGESGPALACRYMPFALTHFVGSGLFNRALRYWARTATKAAKAVNKQADGFKLSEYGLIPIRKVKLGMKGAQSQHKSEVSHSPPSNVMPHLCE